MKGIFTSEAVSIGHPDCVCAAITNAIMDCAVAQDPETRCGLEALVSKNLVVISGEITSKAELDYEHIVKRVMKEIGYDSKTPGFNFDDVEIINAIKKQSSDIAQAVNKEKICWGDQGIMFGFACSETPQLFPATALIANRLCSFYSNFILSDTRFLPDMKSQVTINYDTNEIDTILISASHVDSISLEEIIHTIKVNVITPVLMELNCFDGKYKVTPETKFIINPSGRFVICGPESDAGVTGRKLICDSYGGHGRIGGGYMGGKDYSKSDRSLALYCRYIAKNVVAAGLADTCEIQVSTAIGEEDIVSLNVNTFGTVKEGHTDADLTKLIREKLQFTPEAVEKALDLKHSVSYPCSAGGYFGREWNSDKCFSWEKTNLIDILQF